MVALLLFEMIYTDQVVLTAAVMGLGSIATGEFILVKHDGTDDLAADSSSDWKAKVLEVRALDEEHVYIRVSWLNRPEDLAGGRRDYHGKNELVPTNQIDIIDAMTVNGKFDLKRWTEMKNINPDDALRKEVYYWSQTLDFTSQRLSKGPGADGAIKNPRSYARRRGSAVTSGNFGGRRKTEHQCHPRSSRATCRQTGTVSCLKRRRQVTNDL